jgi:hypothetical protein
LVRLIIHLLMYASKTTITNPRLNTGGFHFFSGTGRESDSPRVKTLSSLRRFEDAIDALIWAWVGVGYPEGNARPGGDKTAAIWCPGREVAA